MVLRTVDWTNVTVTGEGMLSSQCMEISIDPWLLLVSGGELRLKTWRESGSRASRRSRSGAAKTRRVHFGIDYYILYSVLAFIYEVNESYVNTRLFRTTGPL
jgi:hypothetical protein